MGMFATTMLWCFGPNNSELTETAMEVTAPEHMLAIAVLMKRHALLGFISKKKDPGIGAISAASVAVFVTMCSLMFIKQDKEKA